MLNLVSVLHLLFVRVKQDKVDTGKDGRLMTSSEEVTEVSEKNNLVLMLLE